MKDFRASDDVGDKWVSTISYRGLPYAPPESYSYETIVVAPGGRLIHTERSESEEEIRSIHERIVAELTAGTFEPNGKDWKSYLAKGN